MNLLMSRSSRAFIISQNGLEGFVNLKHDNIDSWLYEAGVFIKQGFRAQDQYNHMEQQLTTLKTAEEKEALLKVRYLWVYHTFLEETEREGEVPKLSLEDVTWENYTEYCI